MRPATELFVYCLLHAAPIWCWNHANPEVLDASLAAERASLVAFVSPTEAKSQALEKEWLSIGSASQGSFLSIDCEAETTACARYEITAYPTLLLFRGATPVTKYRGPRRASGISNFVSRLIRPVMTELDESGSLASFEAADEVVFVGYFDSQDEIARRDFAAVANKYRDDFTFGLVAREALITAKTLEPPAVVCHVVQDGEVRTLKSFSGPDDLDRFVREASRPAIGELMPYNQQMLIDRGWPMVYIFGETEADRAQLRSALRRFAQSQYDSLTCVTVDPLEFPRLQEEMGLAAGVFPSGAVHQLSRDRIYPYPRRQPLDAPSLQKWGLDVWQGRVRPWAPPGATAGREQHDAGPAKGVRRRLSVANIPGVNIRVGGRDEL